MERYISESFFKYYSLSSYVFAFLNQIIYVFAGLFIQNRKYYMQKSVHVSEI